ncbi:hypothetical protein DdX_01824 [Ditylenchus destructor]|uniref:Uncharacterized protein n=1 Tax=Ditylenchus destructor TaxID=166010 RepID=A0AAD4RE15_9BILA|nr:hypothetical protein DdX_01824 [Ditylenchus destructor]
MPISGTVPIAEEAIRISHAQIRTPTLKMLFYVTHVSHVRVDTIGAPAASPHGGVHYHPGLSGFPEAISSGGFSGFPEAISSGGCKSCRRDWYQSSWLAERKRLTYHTPKSERLGVRFYWWGKDGNSPIN